MLSDHRWPVVRLWAAVWGAGKRGLWRHRVADAGMPLREPELVLRQQQQNSAAFLREELLSKKSPHARPSSYTSSFTEGETEAQRGLGTHPTDAKLYKIPGISCPVQNPFPGGTSCHCRRHRRCGFDPWVGKIPWRREQLPTPVFLPEESHGQRSLGGYGP